jgi:predicted MFS family arabinose efflux permease
MGASIAGSLLGGALIVRFDSWRIFGLAMLLRIVPIAMQWHLTRTVVTPDIVVIATVCEHFAAGMLTTAMFTYMMTLVDHKAAATEYTILACLQNLGKAPAAVGGGLFAQHFGFGPLFLLGLIFCCVPFIPWWKCRGVVKA